MKRNRAKEHHEKHGDMHGKTCLLAECSIHYPKRRTALTRSSIIRRPERQSARLEMATVLGRSSRNEASHGIRIIKIKSKYYRKKGDKFDGWWYADAQGQEYSERECRALTKRERGA